MKHHKDKKYALGAIAELKRQLENSKTEARKAKILSRIAHWEKAIEKDKWV